MVTVSEKTCVLLEIKSMHKLVQYFESLYRNEDIYELKGVHIWGVITAKMRCRIMIF